MNNAHLHLIVNHLPIIFPIAGLVILLFGIFTKSETSKRNAYILFIIGALSSIAAMATGEGAEEAVEHLPGVAENLIKIHEEAAELLAGLSYVLGAVSLAGLFASYKKLSFEKYVPFAALILAAAALFFGARAGTTGGEIRHTEIRSGAAITAGEGGEEGEEEEGEENESGEMGENKSPMVSEKNETNEAAEKGESRSAEMSENNEKAGEVRAEEKTETRNEQGEIRKEEANEEGEDRD